MKDEKELIVEAEELAKDPAVNVVEEAPMVEVSEDTAKQIYGDALPEAVIQSGIGVGFSSGYIRGAATGVAGEEDERAKTVQKESQDK